MGRGNEERGAVEDEEGGSLGNVLEGKCFNILSKGNGYVRFVHFFSSSCYFLLKSLMIPVIFSFYIYS